MEGRTNGEGSSGKGEVVEDLSVERGDHPCRRECEKSRRGGRRDGGVRKDGSDDEEY